MRDRVARPDKIDAVIYKKVKHRYQKVFAERLIIHGGRKGMALRYIATSGSSTYYRGYTGQSSVKIRETGDSYSLLSPLPLFFSFFLSTGGWARVTISDKWRVRERPKPCAQLLTRDTLPLPTPTYHGTRCYADTSMCVRKSVFSELPRKRDRKRRMRCKPQSRWIPSSSNA